MKIPWVRRDLCGPQVLVMEWIDGIRCTDPDAIRASGLDVDEFIRCGVRSGLRQLLELGLFHGDPHPGNIFALRDGRIAYVDFGNVAQLSQQNKAVLVDAVVHAVNEDYRGMANDFVGLGFLAPGAWLYQMCHASFIDGRHETANSLRVNCATMVQPDVTPPPAGTDITPIVPALENIWADSKGQRMSDFNFRSVTSKFNEVSATCWCRSGPGLLGQLPACFMG